MCINITFGRGKISAYLTQNKTIEDKKLHYIISGLKESLCILLLGKKQFYKILFLLSQICFEYMTYYNMSKMNISS